MIFEEYESNLLFILPFVLKVNSSFIKYTFIINFIYTYNQHEAELLSIYSASYASIVYQIYKE